MSEIKNSHVISPILNVCVLCPNQWSTAMAQRGVMICWSEPLGFTPARPNGSLFIVYLLRTKFLNFF